MILLFGVIWMNREIITGKNDQLIARLIAKKEETPEIKDKIIQKKDKINKNITTVLTDHYSQIDTFFVSKTEKMIDKIYLSFKNNFFIFFLKINPKSSLLNLVIQ